MRHLQGYSLVPLLTTAGVHSQRNRGLLSRVIAELYINHQQLLSHCRKRSRNWTLDSLVRLILDKSSPTPKHISSTSVPWSVCIQTTSAVTRADTQYKLPTGSSTRIDFRLITTVPDIPCITIPENWYDFAVFRENIDIRAQFIPLL